MNAPLDRLRMMADEDLAETISRLQRLVVELRHAQGEAGRLIRLGYVDALDAAQAEQERRRT